MPRKRTRLEEPLGRALFPLLAHTTTVPRTRLKEPLGRALFPMLAHTTTFPRLQRLPCQARPLERFARGRAIDHIQRGPAPSLGPSQGSPPVNQMHVL